MTDVATHLTAAELDAVERVLRDVGEDVAGAVSATLLTAGRSNLTFRVSDGATDWVLRMPPRHGRTPSAHDVAREHRVTSALGSTGVPVAGAIALCEDKTLLGGPFTLSEFVDGVAVQTREELARLDVALLDPLANELVGVLAALHRVDHRASGLETFGRPEGYAERQLRRWSGQWELVGDLALGPLAAEVVSGLRGRLPRQRAASVVHGDFRIDNTLLRFDQSAAPEVAAVVDWELSTIGDPVADVAMMTAYRSPAFDLIVGSPSAWASPALPDGFALASAYEAAGGVELVDFDLHLALANFKIAVIAAGIEHRQHSGSGGARNQAGESVELFLESSRGCLNGASA